MKIGLLYLAALAGIILIGFVVYRYFIILFEASDGEIKSIVRSCFDLAAVAMSTLYIKHKLSGEK